MSEVNASGRFFRYCQSFFIFCSSYSFPYLILGSTMASRISLITMPMSTSAEINMLFVGSLVERPESVDMQVKGRDYKTGLPKEATITSGDTFEALRRPARQITDEILSVLEQTTPELVADIARHGIVLTGGGSLIWGMDKLIAERTGMNVTIADDADSCVAYGCGKALSWINRMQEGPLNIARRRLLKE